MGWFPPPACCEGEGVGCGVAVASLRCARASPSGAGHQGGVFGRAQLRALEHHLPLSRSRFASAEPSLQLSYFCVFGVYLLQMRCGNATVTLLQVWFEKIK